MSFLVIVESPSKAKTLKKYLGEDYEILASYGHVRDLVPKTGAVDTEHQFAMKYQLIERNEKHVDAIVRAAKKADHILLATDPDREGEAIAWHLAEILREKKITPKKADRAHRVPRNHPDAPFSMQSITRVKSPCRWSMRSRRGACSTIWWASICRRCCGAKSVPGLSAGRVQSPALRLIVERELEIEKFQAREYWTIHLDSHKGKQAFSARLVQYSG